MENNKDIVDDLTKERDELLEALRKLYSVRTEPWTDEQRQLKFKISCEVEEILNKYNDK